VLLQSLDTEHPAEAREALGVLAGELRHAGWPVEVAGAGEPLLRRAQPSTEGFVDAFNLILEEKERRLLDTMRMVILTWAKTRPYFRVHEIPVVVVWINGEVAHMIMLPEARATESDRSVREDG
jgi:hypothetical protein